MLSQNFVDVLLGAALGQLLDQPSLHDHKLVLQGDVSIFPHVEGDDEGLNLLVVGLEVLQSNLVEGVQDLEVFWSVLNQLLEGP